MVILASHTHNHDNVSMLHVLYSNTWFVIFIHLCAVVCSGKFFLFSADSLAFQSVCSL